MLSSTPPISRDFSAALSNSLPLTAGHRRRRNRLLLIFLTALGGLVWLGIDRLLIDRSPIVVGILHSQTGPMAISEKSMIDAEVLALE